MVERLSLRQALRPIAARVGQLIREHEILRVSATVHGKAPEEAANEARRQVLMWAQKRCGGRLPAEAWDCETFEYFAGGRDSMGVRLRAEDADFWAIRANDPDKTVPGRIWTTEVVIGARAGQRPRFSGRLLVSTAEPDLQIEPHTPGFVQQVVEACGLSAAADDIDAAPWSINSELDAHALVDRLLDPERVLPFAVLTIADGQTEPALPKEELARAMLGTAQVAVLPPALTWTLTSRLGQMRSVFGGAVRLYLPGFSTSADPFQHRLILPNQLSSATDMARAGRWLRQTAAAESVRRNRLGKEVIAFGDLRNASLRVRQERLAQEGASESEQLSAAKDSIKALETRLEEERAIQEFFDEEACNEKERAETAEAQLRASNYYIQQLQVRLRAKGEGIDDALPSPQSWSEFSDWCDIHLAGRVTLAPPARRGAKDAEFEDLELVARCMQWLAATYRDGRMNGAEGDFRDVILEDSVRNAPCGGDEFEIDWQGRKHTADWHIKNGGNTRDPRRCLRIYYFWEPETQQVVIADMPHHRRTAVT